MYIVNVVGVVGLALGIGLGFISLIMMCFEPKSEIPPVLGAVALFVGLVGLAVVSLTS